MADEAVVEVETEVDEDEVPPEVLEVDSAVPTTEVVPRASTAPTRKPSPPWELKVDLSILSTFFSMRLRL